MEGAAAGGNPSDTREQAVACKAELDAVLAKWGFRLGVHEVLLDGQPMQRTVALVPLPPADKRGAT
jgi:hypothetical protein